MHPINRPVLFVLLVAFVLVFTGAAYRVYRSASLSKKINEVATDGELIKQVLKQPDLYEAAFFRKLAERIQFVPHDPGDVQKLFEHAIIRAPADYRNFLSYGIYVSSSKCCRDRAPFYFAEAVRRKSYDLRIYQDAAKFLLASGHRKEAFLYCKQILARDSSVSADVYRLIERNGGSLEDLIRITPRKGESLISLSAYLSSKKSGSRSQLQRVLLELEAMSMKPEQMVAAARNALKAGNLDWARTQAENAMKHPETQIDASLIVASIYEEEGKWREYEKIAGQIEKRYVIAGDHEKAAAFAFDAAIKLSSMENEEETIERLNRIIKEYPKFAPVYFKMAQLHKNESEAAESFFRKAIELDPANSNYSVELANHYLEIFMISEAEIIFQRLVHIPRFRTEGYLGLAECKIAAGKPDQAIAILQEAIHNDRRSVPLWRQLAQTYGKAGAYYKAAEAYEQLAALTPSRPHGYLLVAEMYEKAGAYAFAEKQYHIALKLDPENKAARQGLSLLQSNQNSRQSPPLE
jgi:tetratricopeptide (TPR) repeat protein